MNIENSQDALSFVDELARNKGKKLLDRHRDVFIGLYESLTFKEISKKYNSSSANHLANVACELYDLLADILEEEDVRKANFRGVVQAAWRRQQESLSNPKQKGNEGETLLPTTNLVGKNSESSRLPLEELELPEEEELGYPRAFMFIRPEQWKTLFDEENLPDASFCYVRGEVLERMERYEESLASYDKAIELQPYYEDKFWYARGRLLEKMGRYQEAITCCEVAIAHHPDNDLCWFEQGMLLERMEQYEESLASYIKAIKLQPQVGFYWYAQGMLLERMEQYEKSLASYDKAIELQPDEVEYRYARGRLLEKMGRDEEGGV